MVPLSAMLFASRLDPLLLATGLPLAPIRWLQATGGTPLSINCLSIPLSVLSTFTEEGVDQTPPPFLQLCAKGSNEPPTAADDPNDLDSKRVC